MTPALDVRHLRLDMNGYRILDDVSLRIGLGERWAVVGPNGAGKSTLLRCFARIHTDWKGRIALHGIDIQGYGNRELARIIAFVPQAGAACLRSRCVRPSSCPAILTCLISGS